MNLRQAIELIASDYGWRVESLKLPIRARLGKTRFRLRKSGKKSRLIWFDGTIVTIGSLADCTRHQHAISIHDPKFEETVRSWFPFMELRESEWDICGLDGTNAAECRRQDARSSE